MRVRRTRCLGTFAVVVLASGLCSTASAEVVELKTLEKRALEQHVSLRAGAARERAAEAGVREARAGYMPRVGFNVDSSLGPGRNIVQVAQYQNPEDTKPGKPRLVQVQGVNVYDPKDKNKGPNPFVPQWRTLGNLVINSTIYDFGRTAATVSASRARSAAAHAEREVTRAQVLSGVRQAYLGWLSSHELHRMSASATDDGQRRSERVSALIQEGARPRGDFAPVESDRLLSALELERSEGDLEDARITLEQTVGEPLPVNAEPDLRVLDVRAEAIAVPTVDPSLRMLANQRAAMEATARVARKAGAPVISANAAVGAGVQTSLNDVSGSFKFLPSYAVGLGIAVPIWDGGGSRASAAGSEARADELRIRIEGSEIERNQDRARARLDAEHAQNREATALQLVEICKTRVTDTEAGYELGAMQFDQVQQARSMLRRAETEVVLAKVARAEAVLRFAP